MYAPPFVEIKIAAWCEDDPRFVIQNWMRNRNTIEFLGVWEELHNPDFNRVQFEAVKNEAGLNRFVMTPTKWITQMNAVVYYERLQEIKDRREQSIIFELEFKKRNFQIKLKNT